jgi:hypothetical protein
MSVTLRLGIRRPELLASLVVALLTACDAPRHRLYEGPARSREQVARITTSGHTFLRSLDGRVIDTVDQPWTRRIEVLPGFHTVEIAATVVEKEFAPGELAAGVAIGLLTLGTLVPNNAGTRTVIRDTIVVSHFHRFEAGHEYTYGPGFAMPEAARADPQLKRRFLACSTYVASARFRAKLEGETTPSGDVHSWETRSLYLTDMNALEQAWSEARKKKP